MDLSRPVSVVLFVVAVVLGVIIARANGSVRDAAVIIGLLALLEGTREVSEATFRSLRERRLRRAARVTNRGRRRRRARRGRVRLAPSRRRSK
jgi:hypothetical protein